MFHFAVHHIRLVQNKLRFITIHHDPLQLTLQRPFHSVPFHSIALHFITLHYSTLHHITSHIFTLHFNNITLVVCVACQSPSVVCGCVCLVFASALSYGMAGVCVCVCVFAPLLSCRACGKESLGNVT